MSTSILKSTRALSVEVRQSGADRRGARLKARYFESTATKRVRRVGNWGRASEHIGRRWEQLGVALLPMRLAGAEPPKPGWRYQSMVELVVDDALQLGLNRVGLTSPDVVVVYETESAQTGLRSFDFKWNLEFAEYRQICAESLAALLESTAVDLIAACHGEACPLLGAEAELSEGVFVAPDTASNRQFLAAKLNTQAQTPLSRENVWLFVVQAQEFFGDLPGWQMAQRLAALDGIGPALHTLETAESYYRLGAGLQGAVSQMQSSIFAEETRDYCAGEAFGRLQERFAAGSSEQLVSAVESEMVARTELLQRLRVLERSPLSLTELARLVRRQGGSMPKDISARDENAGRLRQLLGEVKRLHKAEVRRLGAELVAKGFDDSAALDALAKTTAHFHSLAAANAERLLAV